MNGVTVFLHADDMARELASAGEVTHLTDDVKIGVLEDGMVSGYPSVAFLFALPGGERVLAETSLPLLLAIAQTFNAKYGSRGGGDG